MRSAASRSVCKWQATVLGCTIELRSENSFAGRAGQVWVDPAQATCPHQRQFIALLLMGALCRGRLFREACTRYKEGYVKDWSQAVSASQVLYVSVWVV